MNITCTKPNPIKVFLIFLTFHQKDHFKTYLQFHPFLWFQILVPSFVLFLQAMIFCLSRMFSYHCTFFLYTTWNLGIFGGTNKQKCLEITGMLKSRLFDWHALKKHYVSMLPLVRSLVDHRLRRVIIYLQFSDCVMGGSSNHKHSLEYPNYQLQRVRLIGEY